VREIKLLVGPWDNVAHSCAGAGWWCWGGPGWRSGPSRGGTCWVVSSTVAHWCRRTQDDRKNTDENRIRSDIGRFSPHCEGEDNCVRDQTRSHRTPPPSFETKESCIKITKNVTTRCEFRARNAQKCVYGGDFSPDSTGGAYSALADSSLDKWRPTLRTRERSRNLLLKRLATSLETIEVAGLIWRRRWRPIWRRRRQ